MAFGRGRATVAEAGGQLKAGAMCELPHTLRLGCGNTETQSEERSAAINASLPPGPPHPSLVQRIGFWTRPLAYLERCRARYGKRFTLRMPLDPPLVVLTEPDQVKEIYTAPPDVLHPGEGARVLQPLVGANSVILLDEDAHMEQRKLMLPAFHGEKMERLADLVTDVTEVEIDEWGRDPEIELHPRLQALTLEIILRGVFGLDPGPRLDSLRDKLSQLLAYGDRPITLLPPPPSWMERLLERRGPIAGFFSLREEVDELLFEQVDERRGEPGDRDDVLAMLLEARHEDGSPMSRQELRDELMTLLVAGHETTASALAWAFERLAREPAVLGRLTQEVTAGDDGDYLTATIQETLRRRPVLPNTAPRLVHKPVEVGGWHYPEGVALVANAYLLHHDADIYPDPYAFRPERFLDSPPGTYTWIPFGGGRRRCLGASFAQMEMKIVMRSLLAAYDVRAVGSRPEPARRRNITVRPAAGSRVRLVPRNAAVPVAA
jgi:cytochrome P450